MSIELEQMMNEDAANPIAPAVYELKDIAELAEEQKRLEALLITKNEEISTISAQLRNISENALPAAMASIGMMKFVLSDGFEVNVKKDTFSSIRSGKENEVFEWLKTKGLEGIVKDEIKVNFGMGELEKAKQLTLFCKDELGVSASEKKSIHAGTLKATVKEMQAKGVTFPADLFSIFDFTKTVITAPVEPKVAKTKTKK